jgi:hypothetical protein
VKISEERLAFADHRKLRGLRFFDFDDQISAIKNIFATRHQLSPGLQVGVIRETGSQSRSRLNNHFVATLNQFLHPDRKHGHAVFVVFDFFGYADNHDSTRL